LVSAIPDGKNVRRDFVLKMNYWAIVVAAAAAFVMSSLY
jgi:hypothetical protein